MPATPSRRPEEPEPSDATRERLEALVAPVNAVLGLNALLLASGLNAEQRDLAEGVRTSAQSLLEAVEGVLDLSRIEAGMLSLADEDFDLHAVVIAAGAVVRPAATRKGLWLSVRREPGLPVAVRGDPRRLRQVLINLLGNAITFTDRGSIQLKAGLQDSTPDELLVRLEVIDTGIGMAAGEVRRLLDRADGGVTGPGLGLAVSRRLVELMGGTLDVVSAVGEGSRVSFTVRLRRGDDTTLERHLVREDSAVPPGLLAGRRILLVDDHPVNRETAEAALQRLGASVDTAWDGLDALDRFAPRRYDAVILDVRMPGMDGYAAAREMRRLEDEAMASRTPILALTAAAMDEDRQQALEAGMDAHLGKPFRLGELAEILADLIAGADGAATPDVEGMGQRAPNLAPDPVPAAPHRVLVVDDSPINRQFAEMLVERRGLAVASAENGSAALDLLAAEPYDLVLLDGMMPGLDGPAVAREIRRREAAAGLDRVPIVALTASFLPEDRDRMLEAGMDDHLAKPYSPDDLGRVLGRHLGDGIARRTRPIPPRAAPAAAAPSGDGTPVLDLEAFARLADLGDATFVERIVRLFLADAAERVAQVDDAIEAHDTVRLRGALHALEGICGNVGAAALDRRTRAIHDELRRREDRGEDPFGPGLGPSGLEPLLDATRIRLQEQAATASRR